MVAIPPLIACIFPLAKELRLEIVNGLYVQIKNIRIERMNRTIFSNNLHVGIVPLNRAFWKNILSFKRGILCRIPGGVRHFLRNDFIWAGGYKDSGREMTEDPREEIPLLSGKLRNDAVLNPEDLLDYLKKRHERSPPRLPQYCILAFFRELYDYVEKVFDPQVMHIASKENPMFNPIQVFRHKDISVAHIFPGIGAPNAGAMLELMIAMGGEYFVFIGGVGVLSAEIRRGEILIPNKALRDEGMSFHYQEPSRYSYPSTLILDSTRKSLQEKEVPFREGGTWTTDAFFRETQEKVRAFRDEGCLSVEMEASALFSIAAFRKKHIGGLFKAGDCVAGEEWDARREEGDSRKLLGYALDTLHLLHQEGDRDD